MKTYSLDLRKRVIEDRLKKMKLDDIAAKYDVSAIWVRKLMKVYKETGSYEPKPRGRRVGTRHLADHKAALLEAVKQNPDATLEALCEVLPVKVSVPTLHRELKKLKISFKKRRSAPKNKTGPMSPKSGRSGRSSS